MATLLERLIDLLLQKTFRPLAPRYDAKISADAARCFDIIAIY
jgi:hypothetical protein